MVLIVLSPAKSLDYTSPLATEERTEPRFLDQSAYLVSIMAKKSPEEISELMSISPALGELNFERFQDWQVPFTPDTARQAILAFAGDVYDGMDVAATFGDDDFSYSQQTLRILSGLYGVLRPLDLMMPYRLEMGTRLANNAGKNLYDYWTETVTAALKADIAASGGEQVLINLASQEYFGAVDPAGLDAPVISPAFYDAKGDAEPKVISFWAKKARGTMAAWIVTKRIESVADLSTFDGMGYRFVPDRSTEDRPVFTRRHDS